MRAVPLRPFWPGLTANIAAWGSVYVFVLVLRAAIGSERSDPRRMSRRALRPRVTRTKILVALALGIVFTVVTGVLLPLFLQPWAMTTWSIERPYTFGSRSLFWRQVTTRDNPEMIATLTPADALQLARDLERLPTTTDPSLRKRGPRDEIDAGGPNSFQSTHTGFPFPILWGAAWRINDLSPRRESTNLADITPLRDLAPGIVRGLPHLPTRPLLLGWLANTSCYAAACLLFLVVLDLRRQSRRRRRGRCPACGYDLCSTLPGAPCPECGDMPRPQAALPPAR